MKRLISLLACLVLCTAVQAANVTITLVLSDGDKLTGQQKAVVLVNALDRLYSSDYPDSAINDGTLSVRTDDSSGVMTVPTGTIVEGQKLDVSWDSGTRYQMTAGIPAVGEETDDVPVSGGLGNPLPAEGAEIEVKWTARKRIAWITRCLWIRDVRRAEQVAAREEHVDTVTEDPDLIDEPGD